MQNIISYLISPTGDFMFSLDFTQFFFALLIYGSFALQQIAVRALSRAGYRTCTADDGRRRPTTAKRRCARLAPQNRT
jgi:hypothetical protein